MPMTQPINATANYQVNGKDVRVHAVSTGLISVKTAFLERRGRGALSKLNILLGQRHAPFMPIWVWVIEHPEGIFVIDTGDVEAATRSDFHKREGPITNFLLWGMRIERRITRDDELVNQLAGLGIAPDQIAKIVLTHLHPDHTDGLMFFPENQIIVYGMEHLHPYQNLPTTYPTWFRPTLVDLSTDRIDHFGNAYAITRSKDLWLVPTPGHTHHHCSVLFRTDSEHVLFAGDTSYKHRQLLDNTFAASNIDYRETERTYATIRRYASQHPTVYLPSHDERSGERLVNRETVEPQRPHAGPRVGRPPPAEL
jgi:N-acyl homoserine lactone hydrolase